MTSEEEQAYEDALDGSDWQAPPVDPLRAVADAALDLWPLICEHLSGRKVDALGDALARVTTSAQSAVGGKGEP